MAEEKKSHADEKKTSKTVEFKNDKGVKTVMENTKGPGAARIEVVMESTKGQDTTQTVSVPEKFKDIVEKIEKLNVLELSELVKILREKFGVSESAPMMMAAMPQAGAVAVAGGAAEEEKSEFDVELAAAGDAKIGVIKIVKEITGKGLKEAKDIVDGAPKVVKAKVPKAEAEELKKKLEGAGATVNLK